MSPKQRQALKALIKRSQSKPDWRSKCFPEQLKFIDDPARMKANICTRRAGKSVSAGFMAGRDASENPGVKIIIIGKTNQSVKGIYFDDIMPMVKKTFNLEWDLNRTEMIYRCSNGSQIMFMGADADQDQMNKLLGQKFKLAILDEASMYANINLRDLVYKILRPALADLKGQMVMIGTPSDYLNSLYFDVTTLQEPGWSVHRWTAFDNPHMVEQVKEELAFMRQVNPNIDQDTGFRQHWLGEWVVNLASRVYKYNKDSNKHFAVPKGYQHVLGVDLGYEDDSAFVVGAWSHYDNVLHIVHAESATHLNLDQVELRIKALQARFNIGMITVDGAGKQFVQTLQDRFQMGLHSAEKVGKKDFIELMNTDFLMGRISVFDDKCAPLVKEWENLIWDEKAREKGEWKEARNCPNHAADAALYMWRWCYNYAAIPKAKPLSYEDQMEQDAVDKHDRQHEDFQIYDVNNNDSDGF